MNRFVQFALKQSLMVWLALAVFVGAGAIAFKNLPVEAFPDVSDTQVNVIALYPGRAAEEVEKQVTIPVEIALTGIPHTVRLFSHTQYGLMFSMVTFDDKTTDQLARQQILERLRSVDLPPGVETEVPPPSTAIGEILRFRLRGDGYTPRELRELQDWVVEKALRQVGGVADLVTMGGSVKQYEVNPDLQRLRDHKLGLQDLFAALQRANANAGGGAMTQGRQQFLVRSLGSFTSSADIEQVVVGEHDGAPVLVRDVADVRVGQQPPQGLVGQDDADDIVNGIVLMRKGENPSTVLDGVHAKIEELNTRILPKGVQIEPYYDRSWLIGKTLHTVFHNLTEGALLVMFVLFVFLQNLRAAAIVAAVIPLSLLATFLGLTFVGIPANLLSLGAMDFGIIVDGAVIVVENIFRRLGELNEHQMKSKAERLKAVTRATIEVGRPTLFSMVIIIAAHLPIFTLQRHEGRIFSPMAWSVTSALVGSLVLALSLVPLLCLLLLKKQVPHEDNALVRGCKKVYTPALEWALHRPKRVLGMALTTLAAALALGAALGSEFLPELDEGTIWVSTDLPPSVSPEEAQQISRKLRANLRQVPEVRTVVSKVGRPDDGTDPKIFNGFEAFVDLKPDDQWRSGLTKSALLAQLGQAVSQVPGLEAGISQPIRDNVLESISQIKGQIVVKIKGPNLDELGRVAGKVEAIARGTPGVVRSFVDREGQLPQVKIDIDRAAAARYGINVGDIQDVIEAALAGKGTSDLWEGERHFAVMVRLAPQYRNLDALGDVLVTAPNGAQIPLSRLAHITQTSGAMNIARENGSRVAAIGIFIRDRDMGSVVADLQARAAQEIQLPAGYEIVWSGEFENQQRAMARLSWVVPLSILVIFLLLFDAFKSFNNALLIVANIPFALIGGILALAITGIPLSVSAAIGFIALFGQAVLNGVVMVTYYNQLRAQGMGLVEAVLQGSLTRLRTVLMTALLAMLGLFPMALSHAIGAETQRPLAVVVIGGLVSATVLTLLVLPTIYTWMARREEKKGIKPVLAAHGGH
ncbi:efflux RND transporter permease subunit [Azohydromonas lata]|uniref:CusA/CzcA family heavy metal efflux RND transporter n=1 Tax=Azohydromonas lata TaxID=45677 RepID=A0ABU5IP35_9BURK|nr:CusA/CzcA family heavy metal efflux RND transporter [Azohydromonas lata]MDZ5460663.1 CusA/CzcA family heavy metal efflux RND transporter [Azohydromonas lata]